ncbi:hypothetical protein GF322_05495 [Candidatus Dependentiae bacterium]|nr:hypothetical protein [Candidatus Dependentiae bacterium]
MKLLILGKGSIINKNIFFILFICVVNLSANQLKVSEPPEFCKQGKIVFVTGSCSSGKSSLVDCLSKKINAKVFKFDDYVMPMIIKKFVEKHYGKLAVFFVNNFMMRNFFTTINFLSEKRKYELQKKFYADLQQGLADEPTRKMYNAAVITAQKGNNVVIESPLFLWEGVDLLNNLPALGEKNITYVLAYCPWNDLINRIKQRNLTKNKKNRRELDWVVINFIHNFDISLNRHRNNYLECLNSDNVRNVILEHSKFLYKKQRQKLMPETRQYALSTFNKNNSFYYIYPRFKYSIIINTKVNTPEQGADMVFNKIILQA